MAQIVASMTAWGAVKLVGGASDGRFGGGGGGSPASAARRARSTHDRARLSADRRIGPTNQEKYGTVGVGSVSMTTWLPAAPSRGPTRRRTRVGSPVGNLTWITR